VEVKAKGSVIELRERLTEKQLIALAKKTVEQEIRDVYELGVARHVDTLNLAEAVYEKNPKDWKNFFKNNERPLTNDLLKNIKVELSIDTSGERKFTPH